MTAPDTLGTQIISAVDEAIAVLAAKETGIPREGHYDDQRTTGYVVIHRYTTGKGVPTNCFWYGDEGSRYYNAWGDLDPSVAWYDTPVKAKLAMRRAGLTNRKGVKVVPIAEAKAETAARIERYAATLLARARMLRGEA